MGIIWTIIIGLVAGIVAKFLVPGDRSEPSGFVLTAILGIVGALVATYLGQAVGWYAPAGRRLHRRHRRRRNHPARLGLHRQASRGALTRQRLGGAAGLRRV